MKIFVALFILCSILVAQEIKIDTVYKDPLGINRTKIQATVYLHDRDPMKAIAAGIILPGGSCFYARKYKPGLVLGGLEIVGLGFGVPAACSYDTEVVGMVLIPVGILAFLMDEYLGIYYTNEEK